MQQGSSGGRRLSSTACPISTSSSSSTSTIISHNNKENKRALTAVLSEDGTRASGSTNISTTQQQQQQQPAQPQIRQSFLSKLTRAEFGKQPGTGAQATSQQQQAQGTKATFPKSLNQCDTNTASSQFSFGQQQQQTTDFAMREISSSDQHSISNNSDIAVKQQTKGSSNNELRGKDKSQESKGDEDDEDDDDNLVIPAWPSRSDTLGHKKSEFVQHKVYSLKDYSQVANPSADSAPITTNTSSSGNKLLKSMSQDRKPKTSAKRMSECIYPPQNVLLIKSGSRDSNNPSSTSNLDSKLLTSEKGATPLISSSFSMAPGGTGLLPGTTANTRYANLMAGESKIDRMRKLFVSPLSLRSSNTSSSSSASAHHQNKEALSSQQSQSQQQHHHQGRLSFQSSIAMAGMLNKPHHMIHAMYSGRHGIATNQSGARRSPMRKGQKGNVKSFRVYGCPLQMANNIYPITCFGRPDIYKQQSVPYVLARLCNYIEENSSHLTHEGIFRVSGNARLMEKLRTLFDHLGDAPLESESVDVATSASMLKMYLRELPEPLIPTRMNYYFITLAKKYALYLNSLKESSNISSAQQQQQQQSLALSMNSNYCNQHNRPSIQSTTTGGESSVSSHSFHSSDQSQHQHLTTIERQKLAFARDLTKLLRKLPIENYNLLKYLACFLYRISLKQQYNKMCAEALGIVFGPNVFRIRSESYKGLKEQELSNQIMASIISNYKSIFDSELTDPLGNLVLENQQATIEQSSPSTSAISIAHQQQQQQLQSKQDSIVDPMEVADDKNVEKQSSTGKELGIVKQLPMQTEMPSAGASSGVGGKAGQKIAKASKHSSCCPEHCQACLLDHEPSDVIEFRDAANKHLNVGELVYDDDDDEEDDEDEEEDDDEEQMMNSDDEDEDDDDDAEDVEEEEEDCDVEGESYTPSSGSGSYCSSMNSETLESSDYDEENDNDDEDDDYNKYKTGRNFNRQRAHNHHHHHHHHHGYDDQDEGQDETSSSECPSDTSYTPTSSHSDDDNDPDSDPANDAGEESMNYDDEPDENSLSFNESVKSAEARKNQQQSACSSCKPAEECASLDEAKNQDKSSIEIEQNNANKTVCDNNNDEIEQSIPVATSKAEQQSSKIKTTASASASRQSCRRKHQHTQKEASTTTFNVENDNDSEQNQRQQQFSPMKPELVENEKESKSHKNNDEASINIGAKHLIVKNYAQNKNSLSRGKFDFIRGRSSSASSLGRMKRTRDRLAAAHQQGQQQQNRKSQKVYGDEQHHHHSHHNQSMNRRKLIQYHGQQTQSGHSKANKASNASGSCHKNHSFSRKFNSQLQSGTTYSTSSMRSSSSSANKKSSQATSSRLFNNNKQSTSSGVSINNRKNIAPGATKDNKAKTTKHLSSSINDNNVHDDDNNKDDYEETLCCDNVSTLNLTPQRLMQDLGWDYWSTNYLEELEYDKYFLLRSFNSDETLLHSSNYNEQFEAELCLKYHRRFSGNDFLNVKQRQQLLPITYANHHQCEQIFESCLEADSVLKELCDYVKVVDELNIPTSSQQEKSGSSIDSTQLFKTSCISLIGDTQVNGDVVQAEECQKEGEEQKDEIKPSNELKQSLLSFNVTDNSSTSFNNQFEDILQTQIRALKDLHRLLRKIFRRISKSKQQSNKKGFHRSSKELREFIEKLKILFQHDQYLDDYSACSIDYLSALSVTEHLSSVLKEFDERQLKESNELIKNEDKDGSNVNGDHVDDSEPEEDVNKDYKSIEEILEFKIELLKQRYTIMRRIREHYLRNHSTISSTSLNNNNNNNNSAIMSTLSLSGTNAAAAASNNSESDNKQILASQRNVDDLNNNDDNNNNNKILDSITEQLTIKIIESALAEHSNNDDYDDERQHDNEDECKDDKLMREKSKVQESYCTIDTPVASSSNVNSSLSSQQQREFDKNETSERKFSAPSSTSCSGSRVHHQQQHRHSNDNQPSKSFFCQNETERESEQEIQLRDRANTTTSSSKQKANFPLRASNEASPNSSIQYNKENNKYGTTKQLDFMQSSAASSQQYLATSGASGGSCSSLHESGGAEIQKANPESSVMLHHNKTQIDNRKPLEIKQLNGTCKYGSLCPIEFVYNIEKQLASKRLAGSRIVKLNDMSIEQLLGEKLELQKNLLRYEHWFGRPTNKLDYSLVAHLYERYRAVKLIISAKRLTIAVCD